MVKPTELSPFLDSKFNLVQFSRPVLSDSATPWTAARQASLSITNSQSWHKLMSTELVMPSNHLIFGHPFLLPPSQHQGLFKWGSSSHHVAKVLKFQLQHQWIFRTEFLEDGLVGSPCRPRDFQESSPTPQFKSNSSSVLSFLYSKVLIQLSTAVLL